jgi:hypothetical protein
VAAELVGRSVRGLPDALDDCAFDARRL